MISTYNQHSSFSHKQTSDNTLKNINKLNPNSQSNGEIQRNLNKPQQGFSTGSSQFALSSVYTPSKYRRSNATPHSPTSFKPSRLTTSTTSSTTEKKRNHHLQLDCRQNGNVKSKNMGRNTNNNRSLDHIKWTSNEDSEKSKKSKNLS